jgi:hypothetical protein
VKYENINILKSLLHARILFSWLNVRCQNNINMPLSVNLHEIIKRMKQLKFSV